MKILVLVVVVSFIIGCETKDFDNQSYSTRGMKFKITCIDGVEYLMKQHGGLGYMAPHFKPDGSLHTCGEQNRE